MLRRVLTFAMAFWIHAVAVGGTLLATSVARATPCAPSAHVTGDPELVTVVGELLVRHGILNEGDGCPVVRARLERRGVVIAVVRVSEPIEERLVSEAVTAATVIESWSRSDFQDPLLELHEPVMPSPSTATAPTISQSATPPASYVPPRGVQAFGAMETSFADDRTIWAGGVVGVCIQLGRTCATARARFATVVDGPGMWREAERHAADVLFGGDVPFGLGATKVSFGFGAGMGTVNTGSRASGMAEGSETFGLRADAHVAWIIRLGHRLSFDLSATLDVAQVTDVEGTLTPSAIAEPRMYGRLGAGLRLGGL